VNNSGLVPRRRCLERDKNWILLKFCWFFRKRVFAPARADRVKLSSRFDRSVRQPQRIPESVCFMAT